MISSDPLLSCYRTWGKVYITTGSVGSIPCGGYPKTKAERMYYEKSAGGTHYCITSVYKSEACDCPEGKYFGSLEEGCIWYTEKYYK